jgi:hypothetical protein
LSTIPRRWIGSLLSSSKTGRSIHEKVGTEPRAPDDVFDVESALVLKHGEAVSDADEAGDALDPGSGEILGLDPDQWGSLGEEPQPEPAAEGSVHRQDVVTCVTTIS